MSPERQLPATFGRFRVESLIGEGGMGAVYRAVDPILQRTVAIKTIRGEFADAAAVDRFRREAQACAALQHPNIVTVYEAGAVGETAFIVMECLKGHNLTQAIAEGRLTFEQKITILIRVLDALSFAHAAGIVHRDVKPANIHLLPDLTVKLLDFGLARVAEAGTLTQSNTVMGTPFYASPEQLRGERVDARTDLYSTGVVAYEMFARRRAFDGDSIGTVVTKVLVADPAPINTVWTRAFPEVERIVTRAIAKAAADRYQSAAAMRDDLTAFLEQSRAAIEAKQQELEEEMRRICEEATVLVASGQIDESRTLLAATLATNPDAPRVRELLAESSPSVPSPVADAPAAVTQTQSSTSRRFRVLYGSAAAVIVVAAVALPIARRQAAVRAPAASQIGEVPSGTAVPPPITAAPQPPTPAATVVVDTAPELPARSKPNGSAATAEANTTPETPPSTPVPPSVPARNATAKQLFYAGDAPRGGAKSGAATESGTGLRYRLLSQLAAGDDAEVAPDTTFKSGDKVRFAFESNVDGYLYVIEEGSSGQWRVLFPNPQINGGTNEVRKFESYPVPSSAWFVFDEHPGTERLFVLLSKDPLRELPGFNQPVTQLASVDRAVVERLNRELKSRDLVFESDSGTTKAPAAYVVNRDQLAKQVATTIELVHR